MQIHLYTYAMSIHIPMDIPSNTSCSSVTESIPLPEKRRIVNSSSRLPQSVNLLFYWRLFIFQQFSKHEKGGGWRGGKKRDQGDHDKRVCGSFPFSSSSHSLLFLLLSSILFLQATLHDTISDLHAGCVRVISPLPYVSLVLDDCYR